ncbi:flagellar protein FliT [Peribacillus asahii]|uniref:flagellar protein FliT n=1 Tax=Peribacillus asahii TaxID=228899 RepID=UPI00207A44F1|nr:flagellar protein FliT [Peribacillus asahii]USK69958.1 flagellar protein FliT [Peribacillus asahii]
MKALQDFYELTQQLIVLLKHEKSERAVQIEKIQQLLDQREELLNSIQPPFSEQEQELGKQLVALNKQVEHLLQIEKLDIMKDMKQLQVQKKSNQKYTNPYESLAIDGIFYDKRN